MVPRSLREFGIIWVSADEEWKIKTF